MALGAYNAFVESFSIYGEPTTTINQVLASRYNNPQIFAGGADIDLTGGREGRACLNISRGSAISKTLAHSSHWIAGNAGKTGTVVSGGDFFFALYNNNVKLFGLNVNPDGTLSMCGVNNSQIIGTTALPYVTDFNWFQWEVDVTFSGTTNILVTAELRINGVVVLSGSVSTGINKANLLSNSATANVLSFGNGMVSAGGFTHDGSFYIHDGSGNVPGYWGDIRILHVVPNGDTAEADWTPNSGSVHYDRVHELPKDDDVTYLADGTPGDKDVWDWENLSPLTGVVRTVQLSIAARKDDEGSKSFKSGVGDTLSEATSDEFFVNDSYVYFHTNWDTDPATGLPWTIANFNAKRFGVEVIS